MKSTSVEPIFNLDRKLSSIVWLDTEFDRLALSVINRDISFQLLKATASWQVKYISWKNKDSIQGL